jgi:multicomponent Na+:H+ antiporter subunit E
MAVEARERTRLAGPLLARAAAYFVFWLVVAGTGAKDLAVGMVTALAASWMSLSLLPRGELTMRPGPAVGLFLRFLWQSVVAGITVARIALSPIMPLRPGMVAYRTKLAPGNRRLAFMTFASLLPGTLPTGTDDRDLISVHALDDAQPVDGQLAHEEAKLTRVFAERTAP